MKVLRCVFPCLFVFFHCVLCKDNFDMWLQSETTDVTYGASTPLEEAQSTFQCLLKCTASEGCQSANVNPDNFQCELSAHHPTEEGLTVNKRPGWTVYYKGRNCMDMIALGDKTTGFKTIIPDGKNPVRALCVMDEDGGGWTVLQKRESATDFYKNWQDYKNGFGDNTHFWLGLENIYHLTAQENCELRVDMIRINNSRAAAKYQTFSVGNETMFYKLTIGNYSFDPALIDPRDSFLHHNGMNFTTFDKDNDAKVSANCAVERKGGWWYNACHRSNLNGVYGSTTFAEGINWFSWTDNYESLKYTRMMIRPKKI